MKKILTSIILLTLGFFSFRICNVNASESDASARGYSIAAGWKHINDVEYDYEEVWGERYYEGEMASWMGIYTHLDEEANELFVLTLCTGKMRPNQKSYWDQKRWNNQEMKIEFYPETTYTTSISEVTHGPKASEGTTAWSSSVGVSGSDLSVEFGNSHTTSDIVVKADLGESQKNMIIITHSFVNYSKNTNIKDVCCSLVEKNNFAVFKIKNYDATKTYNFHINYTATFYRLGVFNSASVSERQTQVFTI